MSAESGEVLLSFCALVVGKMLRRDNVILNLIKISCFAPRFRKGTLVTDPHGASRVSESCLFLFDSECLNCLVDNL